ncbi:hypothetical protein TPHA_0E03990 [Tetrapisispora phaffii CBS 4417]|uniref:Antisense of depressing factor protein 1 n=1 Tax=Tetrapisispora phaffii (strain ATCC 24235 / CBS 4417 / NBRC 1672 / NRRL Y-8282 / UCD 70-5) TaxID=1071381 RepID=G8BUB0_TETPH|nr:hypothetical protein TPHA_0E03990 [Tetrapisispora phaffii CBS 4417]CCE63488.1 hypothetical protein TPHA_0E03990 [Tetrapisispora phaffii CBS 4417]
MAKGKSNNIKKSFRNNGKNVKDRKNIKGKLSSQVRKSTKHKVEKLNKLEVISSDDINALNALNGKKREKQTSVLEAKTLAKDNLKDRQLIEKIESKKKETNASLLQQIEMMSGFSL